MPNPTTLPILAGLSILGTALGVNLGHSAISEINPAYFSEPEAPFHADLVPYRSPEGAQMLSAQQQQAFGPELVSCVGCTAQPAQAAIAYVPVVDGFADGWSASASNPVQAQASDQVIAPPRRDPELERIERYASYAVSAEEAAAVEAEAEEAELALAGTD